MNRTGTDARIVSDRAPSIVTPRLARGFRTFTESLRRARPHPILRMTAWLSRSENQQAAVAAPAAPRRRIDKRADRGSSPRPTRRAREFTKRLYPRRDGSAPWDGSNERRGLRQLGGPTLRPPVEGHRTRGRPQSPHADPGPRQHRRRRVPERVDGPAPRGHRRGDAG